MKLTLIRNASLELHYASTKIIVDPMLCPKETFPPFAPGLKKNPTSDLTVSIESIVTETDAILVTHSHPDHFDPYASKLFPKNTPIYCTPADLNNSYIEPFENVIAIDNSIHLGTIKITRVFGQHGSGTILPHMGKVSGYILEAPNEPTLYITSDTILTEEVKETLANHTPKVIVANAGGGLLPTHEKYPVMMNETQVCDLAQLAPSAKIVAVHLESIDFCPITRQSLKEAAKEHGLTHQIFVPEDGEELIFD